MAPPVIHGEPKIVQDTKTNTVSLEVVVSGWCFCLFASSDKLYFYFFIPF